MTNAEIASLAQHEPRLARLIIELEHTRAVLTDLLEERGLPQWLAVLIDERETLLAVISKARRETELGRRGCCGGTGEGFGPCRIDCHAARLARLVDERETQRQVDEAHAWALLELADLTPYTRRPWNFPTRESLERITVERLVLSDAESIFGSPPSGDDTK